MPRTVSSRWLTLRFAAKCCKCGGELDTGTTAYWIKGYKRGTSTVTCKPCFLSDKRVQYFDSVVHIQFDSLADAMADAFTDYAQVGTNRLDIQSKQKAALTGFDSWGDHYTKDQLFAELVNPPAKILESIQAMRDSFQGELQAPTRARRRIRHGQDNGQEIDIDRWSERDSNCWDTVTREAMPAKTVNIAINVAASGNRTAKDLLPRGAAALALADILAERGYSVGITLFLSVKDPTTTCPAGLWEVTLKAPDMPMDIGTIAFSACSIAFMRTVAVLGSSRHYLGTLNSNLGQVRSLPADQAARFDYVIDSEVLSESSARAWLESAAQRTERAVA